MATTTDYHQSNLPNRSNTGASEEDAIPDGDPSSTTGILFERLQAWKHMVSYLEDYVKTVSKGQHSEAKEQEKILKTVSQPLKHGHHFDQENRGVAGLFENIRSNTRGLANLHDETAKNLHGTVLPMLERLHKELKAKAKELDSGAGKQSKAVDKARNATQKHIELLGQYTATADSAGAKIDAAHDPYVIQRGIHHRLNQQILEENNSRSDLLTVQKGFQEFEAHVLGTIQNALVSFSQFMGNQGERQKAMYGDMAGTAQKIPHDFEWKGFVKRHEDILMDPDAPPRRMSTISFPNQDHRSTRPLIEGSLERKARGVGALTGYKNGYYAVTPAGYLHEYKDNDDFHKDPTPELSLYLPDSTIGAVDEVKFSIKGKDVSGSTLGQKMHMSAEYHFKANPAEAAAKWHSIISAQSGKTTDSLPVSPVESQAGQGSIDTNLAQQSEQEKGATASSGPAQPATATSPAAATTTGNTTGTGAGAASNMTGPSSAAEKQQVGTSEAPHSAGGQGSHFHESPATK